MSPRRSSRARTTQPPPSAPAHSTSSSSVSSARTDRATRSNIKQSSPQKSTSPHSLSSEEADDPNQNPLPEPPLTRRRTREQDNDEDDDNKLDDELDDDIAEEEEITRCICGHQEYPGPPSDAGKSKDGQSSSLTDSDLQTDEAGGLFIQCDICKVWQHGGCVGIMDEAACPEEYFCEECRRDLHKVTTSPKGQKYSRYLPVADQGHSKNTRKGSVSKEPEGKSSKDKDRNARASADSFTKRRSTMNSRAAYDEDEVLRKVLEESKGDGGANTAENGSRKKRSRDDSEEIKQEPKRQRTGSQSPSSSPTLESDDEALQAKNNGRQKPRGAAARSQREKEQRDKEREKEKAEAANRRKNRMERRRAEDPDLPEATLQPEESTNAPSATESVAADTPSAPPPAPAPKKSGRPSGKSRGGRLGRNQYTRDLPTPTQNGLSPREQNDTPNSPQINGTGNGHESSDGAPGSKSGRSRHWKLEKLSWNEIKRPASAIQNYITQRQVEMAGEGGKTTPPQRPAAALNGNTEHENGKETNENADNTKKEGEDDNFDIFKKLNTLQMMDDISRDLAHWHKMITEAAEK